jgi:hypothetical protein
MCLVQKSETTNLTENSPKTDLITPITAWKLKKNYAKKMQWRRR